MDPATIGILALLGMLLLIAMHVPLAAAMGIAGFTAYGLMAGFRPAATLFGSEAAAALSNSDLAVIPLFLLMGGFAGLAGLSGDLYKIAYALVGHRRGGLAMATIGGCAGFSAVCGSAVATAATMTRVALPEMRSRGYAPGLATGSIASGGTLGFLIPPSVIMVLYSFLTEQPVLTLFVAAIIPGIVAVILYIAAIAITVRLDPTAGPAGERMPWGERLKVIGQAWGALLLIAVISIGIYGGIFTVTEAAAVGAALTLFFAAARGHINRRALWEILQETASTTAMIYAMIIAASTLIYGLTLSRLPEITIDWIGHNDFPPLMVIFGLLVFYIILGAIFDEIAAMVITMPFVFPLVTGMGYDPIWWGIVNVMVIEIGLIAPPIGINVFILHALAKDVPLTTIYRGIMPFLYADCVRLALLVLFPSMALWLPSVLR